MYTAIFIAVSFMILTYLKFTNFRRFLLFVAFLVGLGINSCVAHVYGTRGPIFVIYFIIPLAAVIITNVLHMAFTDMRKLLISLACLAGLGVAAWVFCMIAPLIAGVLMAIVILGILFQDGGDIFTAEIFHSGSPDVSVGEALVLKEID